MHLLNRKPMHSYTVAGLTISSEIPLPELLPHALADDNPDVEIRCGPVPDSLPGAIASTSATQITQDAVLLEIPGVGRFCVHAGKEVRVQPDPAVEAQDLRLFLLGSAFGAIWFQRGFFPLHASVVVINGGAIAFSGDPGAGKSTLAAWLNSQGYPLLCDDVCVIRFADDEQPVAYPAFPRLKLWTDALSALDIDHSGLQRDYSRADKYHLSAEGEFRLEPAPLRHINLLRFSDDLAPPRIEDIKPAHAVPLLRDNTYRFQYISGLGLTRRHFLDCVKLARNTQTHFLIRPRQFAAMADCQRLVEEQAR
jgi:hypothetical protein